MELSTKLIKERYQVIAPTIVEALRRRGFEPYFCKTAGEAVETALSFIPENATVSWGGSLTLEDIGIIDKIKEGGYRVIDRKQATTEEEKFHLSREALLSDVYLSSVNAISEDGTMFNIDGVGNRIAAIAYGPKNVILIVGMNKVCRDAKTARERARTYAAPINGMRLSLDLPCVKTGYCHDCNAAECICSQIVEMRRNRIPNRVKVILVGEDLGL